MEIGQAVEEVFDKTFAAIGDSELKKSIKRELLYNLYCFACAVDPAYAAHPHDALFEYGCCFLLEPERHPDYSADNPAFKPDAPSADVLTGGGRWLKRRGKDFIKYDYGSPLFERLLLSGVIPEDMRAPIDALSLYAAVYCVTKLFEAVRGEWLVYYFLLNATNEPVDEEYDDKLFELLHAEPCYAHAVSLYGSMLIGDETELSGSDKLLKWYKPFIDYRREHICEVFEDCMAHGKLDFVCEYSAAMLNCYPESTQLMNWNAAARTERIVRDRDGAALNELIADLREYSEYSDSPVIKKYLDLAELAKKTMHDQSA